MRNILVGKSFETKIYKFFSHKESNSESSFEINIYTSEIKNKFLLDVMLNADNQCEREGYSFILFNTYKDLRNFLINDIDIKTHCTEIRILDEIEKINNDPMWYY